MPKESLSVYLTAVDGMTPVLASITDKTKALDKESQELTQTYEALQKADKALIAQKTELQKQLQAVNKEVKEARKQFNKLKDEASSDAYEKAQEKQQKLRNEIAATTKALQENQKIYKENIETIRKGSMEEQGTSKENIETIRKGSMEEQGTSLGDIAKGMFSGQIGQMFSSSLGGLGQSLLTSAVGTSEASLISDTLSSAIAVGAAGAMFGPAGILAGAALGGISGAISGQTKIFEAKNDAFRDYYGGLYSDVKGRSGEMVESGSALASGRETDRISFKTLFGSEKAANKYLDDLVSMANTTPFLYDDLVGMSKTLATYGYNQNNILPLLQTVGDAGAALGMGTSDMNSVAQALGRMKSSDKTTLEYLNMLNDRGIGAVGMLADAYGVSQGDMYEMISKGSISGSDAVDIITEALQRAYSGSMLEQSQTFAGISSTLEGLKQELENAGGDAYNSLRMSGQSAMVEAYGGALGDAIKEINAVMGENQARKENLQDQYMREVLDAVLNGNQAGSLWSSFSENQQNTLTELSHQYAAVSRQYEDSGRTDAEAAAQMESLYEQAQTLGQAYYENSDFVQMLNDTELDEINALQEAVGGLEQAYTALYDLNQTMSKGVPVKLTGGLSIGGGPASDDLALAEEILSPSSLASGKYTAKEVNAASITRVNAMAAASRNAFGLDRVPYDEYPALLHEGERVLTASEARAQDAQQGSGISMPISGNTFVGTSEEMADQLWEIIMRKLEQAYTAAAPK